MASFLSKPELAGHMKCNRNVVEMIYPFIYLYLFVYVTETFVYISMRVCLIMIMKSARFASNYCSYFS